jgi:hypothetical protein
MTQSPGPETVPVRPVDPPAPRVASPARSVASLAPLLDPPAPPSLAPSPPGVVSLTSTTALSGRRIAIPRRIVERDRRYRNLKNEFEGTEFQAQNLALRAKVHSLKRAMYDIEDERQDGEEKARKRAKRE